MALEGRADGRLGRFGAALSRFTDALALGGGLILCAVMAMTVVSVVGRKLFGAPVPGDYEITELACGVAIFAFFPRCQLHHANIVVEFFTARLSPRAIAVLEAIHDVVFAGVALLIAWRLVVGWLHKLEDGETTMFLSIPLWWGYTLAVVSAITLAVVALWVIVRRAREARA